MTSTSDSTGDVPSPWRRLWQLAQIERRDLWVLLLYASGIGIFSLATPLAAQTLLTTVAFGNILQPIVVLAFLVATGLVFAASLNAAQVLVVEYLSRRIFLRVASRFRDRLAHASRTDDADVARLSKRFLDVVTVEKTLSVLLLDGVSGALQILVGLTLLAVYHPFLLAFGLAILVAILFITGGLGYHAVKTAVKESKTKYAIADEFTTLAGHRSQLKARSIDTFLEQRASTLFHDWMLSRRAHFRVVFRQTLGLLALQVLVTTALFGLGGWLVLEERLAIGQLVAAEIIVTATVAQLAKFGKYFAKTYDLLASLDKLGTVADFDVIEPGGEKIDQFDHGIDLNLEHVRPTPHTAPVSVAIPSGTKVHLTGPEAVGKSRLLFALSDRCASFDGLITLDDIPVGEIDMASLSECTVRISEEKPWLIPGTLDDNLRLGRQNLSEEIRAVLRAVGLEDAVNRLPNGSKTDIDVVHQVWSNGQLSRLTVARVLLLRPRLMLVDGFFDVLNASFRQQAIDLLLAPTASWTAVVVSNDPHVTGRCTQTLALMQASADEDGGQS